VRCARCYFHAIALIINSGRWRGWCCGDGRQGRTTQHEFTVSICGEDVEAESTCRLCIHRRDRSIFQVKKNLCQI
jgi:hypothetical protein